MLLAFLSTQYLPQTSQCATWGVFRMECFWSCAHRPPGGCCMENLPQHSCHLHERSQNLSIPRKEIDYIFVSTNLFYELHRADTWPNLNMADPIFFLFFRIWNRSRCAELDVDTELNIGSFLWLLAERHCATTALMWQSMQPHKGHKAWVPHRSASICALHADLWGWTASSPN